MDGLVLIFSNHISNQSCRFVSVYAIFLTPLKHRNQSVLGRYSTFNNLISNVLLFCESAGIRTQDPQLRRNVLPTFCLLKISGL